MSEELTIEQKNAMRSLENGEKYPYDDSVPLADWAHAAARGILADLSDRRGIKNGLNDVDDGVRAEIVSALSEIIRQANRCSLEAGTVRVPVEPADGWISVNDRLPDDYVAVLIGRTDIPEWVGPTIAFRKDGEFYADVMKAPLHATHWMPLPSPPSVQEKP